MISPDKAWPACVQGTVLDSNLVRLRHLAAETWTELTRTKFVGPGHLFECSANVLADTTQRLSDIPESCIHAIVTAPPYGLIESSKASMEKERAGQGDAWSIPPSFDSAKCSPMPPSPYSSRTT